MSALGLTVTGSGRTVITSAPAFRGWSHVLVSTDGTPSSFTPNPAGRITFPVDLGPADLQQQYTPRSAPSIVTVGVTFTRG